MIETHTTPPTLKAYLVDTGDDEGAQIYFASTPGRAKARAAGEDGIEFVEVGSCKRMPQFDQYAATGIPAKAYIQNGWWLECWGCHLRCSEEMDEDVEDDDGNPIACDGPIYRGHNGIWCSTQCQQRYDERKAEEKRLNDADIAATLAKWPLAKIAMPSVRGDGKRCVYFKFGGTQDAQWVIGETVVHIAQIDFAAWDEFKQKNQELLHGTTES